MPVIINEIQITAYVSEQANAPTNPAPQNADGGSKPAEQQTEQIIKSCVEEVLRIVKEQKER